MKFNRNIAGAIIVGGLLVSTQATKAITIVNGDFESGNSGFTSEYNYVIPGAGNLNPAGTYTVDTNPQNSHNLFFAIGDHTTGTGNMMIVNGDSTSKTVWSGTADSALGVGNYVFSFWMASVYSASPGELETHVELTVGDTVLGSITATTDGGWTEFSAPFTVTGLLDPPTGDFSLFNLNFEATGNDFAIDDISLSQVSSGPAMPDGGSSAALLLLSGVGLFAAKRRLAVRGR